MKKTLQLMLLLFALLLVGCTDNSDPTSSTEPVETTEDPIYSDTIKPLIQIDSTERVIVIRQRETYDWMKGIKGIDNLEGNITDRIEINMNDFNAEIPGEYTIFYYLNDSAGNSANPVSRTVIVWPTDTFQAPEVYTGTIANEAPKPERPDCFDGAWYRKVVSARDQWVGLEGTVTLPEIDINRYNGQYDTNLNVDPDAINLDNPSVYMGGNADYESDVGLSLSKGCVDGDCSKVSQGSVVFRPFWRYITNSDYDEGSYADHLGLYSVSCSGSGQTKNCFANWHYKDTQYYYLPGDKIRMIVYSPRPNYLQLQIEVIEVSTLPESKAMREKYGWKDPENFISPEFRSPGVGTGKPTEYKRVNAIDQKSNEGKPAIPTTTEIKNAIWHEVYLYREIDDTLYRVPFDESRAAYMSCPYDDAFIIESHNPEKGGEVITISPSRLSTTATTNILAPLTDLKRRDEDF